MKKAFLLLSLLSLLSSNITLAVEIPRPTFEEFCPPIYYHKDFISEDAILPARFTTKQKAALWSSIVVLYPAIITYPLAISDTKWRRQQKSNIIREEYNTALSYWKQREASFEHSLSLCDTLQEKATCYLQVKFNEQQKDLAIQQNEILKGISYSIGGLVAQQAITNMQLQQLK